MSKGRPAHVDKPVRVHNAIPESIYNRTQIILYSELEGRVPYGAMSTLVSSLLRDWLETRELDLTAFGILGKVRGQQETISQLTQMLINLQRKERE
jgi:hypothetical protein